MIYLVPFLIVLLIGTIKRWDLKAIQWWKKRQRFKEYERLIDDAQPFFIWDDVAPWDKTKPKPRVHRPTATEIHNEVKRQAIMRWKDIYSEEAHDEQKQSGPLGPTLQDEPRRNQAGEAGRSDDHSD